MMRRGHLNGAGDLHRLERRSGRKRKAADLPPLPKADADGNYPAIDYARASLSRNIIRGRVEAGLTQLELAKLAGIRNETLCRLERGQHSPSVATLARIDQALKQARGRKGNGRGR